VAPKPTAKPVDPEEEEKKRKRKEEQEKQRLEMKARMAQMKQETAKKEEANVEPKEEEKIVQASEELKTDNIPKDGTAQIKQEEVKEETKEEPKVEEKPIETAGDNIPIGTKKDGMPSWADYMKQMQEDEAKNPTPDQPKPAKTVAKKPVVKAKPVDPEEEEKKRKKKEEQEKQRKEMREKMKKLRQAAAEPESPAKTEKKEKVIESPAKIVPESPVKMEQKTPPSPSKLEILTSSNFQIQDFDSLINLEMRAANDVPKFSRKDVLKIRYFTLESTRDDQKEAINKREQLRKKVAQEIKDNALLRSTIMQYTDIADTLGPLIQETKKFAASNAEKTKQVNEATATYEQLRTALDAAIKLDATLGDRLGECEKEHKLALQRYTSLRFQAEQKIKKINEELLQLKAATDAQLFLNAAKLSRSEHQQVEMTERIAIQEKTNSHLMKICEEMVRQLEKTTT